jgi:hypothetical protein
MDYFGTKISCEKNKNREEQALRVIDYYHKQPRRRKWSEMREQGHGRLLRVPFRRPPDGVATRSVAAWPRPILHQESQQTTHDSGETHWGAHVAHGSTAGRSGGASGRAGARSTVHGGGVRRAGSAIEAALDDSVVAEILEARAAEVAAALCIQTAIHRLQRRQCSTRWNEYVRHGRRDRRVTYSV